MFKSFAGKYFRPDKKFKSVDEINLDDLKKEGIKGIILDLDDTLLPSDKKTNKVKIDNWIKKAKKDFLLFVVSNNTKIEYVKKFCEKFDIPFIARATKPRSKFLEKAMIQMKLRKQDLVIVGDRVTTDVLAGKIFGIKTFLVKPLTEMPSKLQRTIYKIEEFILRRVDK